jgi:hypothetical protein
MVIVVTLEGRLKSPAIDFDHENPSIGGDFNRPFNVAIVHKSFAKIQYYILYDKT